VTLFEADSRLGGHSNTVIVDDPDVGPLGVDTGFIVHNDRNYPNLVRLFSELDIPTQNTDMSFGVEDRATGFAYRATNPATLLARPANAVDGRFWAMLRDVFRFFRHGQQFLRDPDPSITIGEFIAQHRFSDAFVDLHLVPMGAAVWSTSPEEFTRFPAASLLRFLDNHGLLSVGDRPQWRTVVGGSMTYVQAVAARFGGEIRRATPVRQVRRLGPDSVEVTTDHGPERFDAVILACHSDQARKLVADLSSTEDSILDAIGYAANTAVLHTDTSFLPQARRAWAAWNYHVDQDAADTATLTYDMTDLQRLPGSRRYLVSLNPHRQPEGELARFNYAHPQFTLAAMQAQQRWDEIDGDDGLHFCGAYWGYGFHEDGFVSALRVCAKFGVSW
jgi:predicted NAD/FAD-binding protein